MNAFRNPLDEWLKATVGDAANKLVTSLDKLTDQQFMFCLEYVKTASVRKAANKAKLPQGHNPSLLLHLPKISACINILHARQEAALGQKSSAEIVERLNNTVVFESDDFEFSEDALKERTAQLGDNGKILGGSSTEALLDNVNHADVSNGIMQLPKIKVPPAQSFGPQWIIERFVTVAERCLQIEAVFDRKGRPIGTFKFEPNAALKALEMLGKTMALFRERIEVSHEVGGFTDGELDARLKSLAKQFPDFTKIINGESEEVKRVAAK